MSLKSVLFGAVIALGLSSLTAQASTLKLVSPTPQSFVFGTDFNDATFSALGSATGHLDTTVGLGCSSLNYSGFTAGSIALIARGTCSFSFKVDSALAAGAIGVLIYNNAAGLPIITLGSQKSIPTMFLTNALGLQLLGTRDAVVSMTVAPTSSVPLPAALPLLASSLGAMGFAAWRRSRKRAASAV